MPIKIYLVGGAVRDELLGIPNNDRDYVVVGATETDMLALGYKKVGADFPVFLDENGDQYALARKERKVAAGYGGFECEFGPSVTLKEDLFRRDFTINALAKDLETGEIIDYFNGIEDLQNGVLRHVSEAFVEDPLRVIRLARFVTRWYNFSVHPDTVALCNKVVSSGEMESISDERYWAELVKTFEQSQNSLERFFTTLQVCGFCFDGSPATSSYLQELFFGDRSHPVFRIANDNKKHRNSGYQRLRLCQMGRSEQLMKQSPEIQAILFCGILHGLCSDKNADRSTIPTAVKKVATNIRKIRMLVDEMSKWPDNAVDNHLAVKLHDIIKEGRFNDESFEQFLIAIKFWKGHSTADFIELLIAARQIIQTVKAADFPHLSGKELGAAISERCKQLIAAKITNQDY